MKNKAGFIACILAALFCGPTANASVIITLKDVGPNVVATGSGALDLAALARQGSAATSSFVSAGQLLAGSGGTYDVYSGISGPTSFGSGPLTNASSGTGDRLGIDGTFLGVAVFQGYVSGAALSSTATWDNTTLADLGLTSGTTYTWTWGSGANADFLTLNVGVPATSSVPEPASALLLMLGLALCGAGLFARKRGFRTALQRRASKYD